MIEDPPAYLPLEIDRDREGGRMIRFMATRKEEREQKRMEKRRRERERETGLLDKSSLSLSLSATPSARFRY